MNSHLISVLMLACSVPFYLGQAMEYSETMGYSKTENKRSLPDPSSYPCKMVKVTNEEPVKVVKELNSCLKTLSHSIHQAHQEADATIIEKAYVQFLKLSKIYKSEDWQHAKLTMTQWIHPSYLETRLYQWPAQKTEQEIIGGHLFYPPHLNDLLDCPYTGDLIQRKDYVFALAAAAHHHHSLAHYYLVRTLEDLSLEDYKDMNKEGYNFFYTHYKVALEELEHCQDHPDACYILGTNYNFDTCGRMSVLDYEAIKAHEFFTKGKDTRNKLAALELREDNIVDFPARPRINDYLTLARESGYGPAYISAVDLMEELEEDEEKKLSYLQEALQLPYYPALIELGNFYIKKGDKEKALHYFEEAGKKGISYGYIQAALLTGGEYIVPLTLTSKEEDEALAALPDDKVTQAQQYYEAAGKAHDPRGWAYLAEYCITLLIPDALQGHREREQEFRAQALRAIEQGIKLGSSDCFGLAVGFPEQCKNLLKVYGPATYGTYYQYIEKKFLK